MSGGTACAGRRRRAPSRNRRTARRMLHRSHARRARSSHTLRRAHLRAASKGAAGLPRAAAAARTAPRAASSPRCRPPAPPRAACTPSFPSLLSCLRPSFNLLLSKKVFITLSNVAESIFAHQLPTFSESLQKSAACLYFQKKCARIEHKSTKRMTKRSFTDGKEICR